MGYYPMGDFYAGQNAVVLGGAGFVGRHLCRSLQGRGANVFVIDNFLRNHNLQWKRCYGLKNKPLSLDIILNRGMFLDTLDGISPFAVFNLAASVAGVEFNQKHQGDMFSKNAQLQTIPVAVCERLEVPHFLQVSSACVYGEDANAPAVEDNLGGEPTRANAGYSWAKRMGERVVQWSSLPHAVIVRPSNIYGPGDWYDERAHVIPKLIRGYGDGTVKIFAGHTKREFVYVEDVVRGMLAAMEFGGHKQVYNLGSNDVISMYDLHLFISTMMDKPLAKSGKATFDQGDDIRCSNIAKMTDLGWCAETPLMTGLEKTIEAYLGRG